jgi:hypothetical protein
MVMTLDRRRRLKQGALLGALLGILLSQYQPLWGDGKQLRAEPWSMTRKTLMTTHVPAFVALGLGVSLLIAHVRNE